MASSKAAIWMTFAAAAGTLVVAIGVIAGPTLVRCSSDPVGLLSCLRGEVVEVGLLPEPPDPAGPQAPEPGPPPETREAQPATPDLNLVRAEPDGQVIIAGTGTPGIEVEVFANGDLVGKVKAEASGDWVLVPDRPLAVGTAEISVGASGSNERSPHTFTVTIAADKVSRPTITASESIPPLESGTAEPSPVTPEPRAAETTDTAPSKAPVTPVSPSAPEPVDQPPETAEPASAPEPELLPQPAPEIAAAPAPRPQTTDAVVPKPPPAAASVPPADPEPKAEPEVALAPEPEPQLPAPKPAAPEPAPAQVAAVPTQEPVPAPVAPPAEEPPMKLAEAAPVETLPGEPPVTPVPVQPTTIDAIEIDGTANYFAGAGPEGATVNLYVQDRFIASAKVEGGRWLVEARGALNLPVQRVRIDLVEPQQGDVSARAEVNFVIDVPPPAREIEVNASASGSAAPAATATGDLAIAPQAESELEVDPAIPTIRSLPAVDAKMLRFASGKAIIRRGETLWEIAERVYGDGNQYRRIVEANDALITRPGRIFPGQVFDLPKLEAPATAN